MLALAFTIIAIACLVGFFRFLFASKERSYAQPVEWAVHFSVPVNGWYSEKAGNRLVNDLTTALSAHDVKANGLMLTQHGSFLYLDGTLILKARSKADALQDARANIQMAARQLMNIFQFVSLGKGDYQAWLSGSTKIIRS